MKKIVSRNLYSVLGGAVILPLVLCSCSTDIKASSANVSEAAAAVIEQLSSAGESATVTAAAENAVPGLILSKCYLLESGNYQNVADGYYQAVLLTEDSAKQFPALNDGLTELNKSISEQCTADFKKLTEDSSQYIANNPGDDEQTPTGTLESRIVPLRQDSSVVSFFVSCYSNVAGAPNGKTSYSGYTLDASTGKQVALEDIVKDMSALVTAVNENLVFMNTGESAGDREEVLMVNFASENYFPSWVLSDNGILFRFAPEEIGTYEEGSIEAEVPFSKYPDLFTGKYGPHTGSYSLQINTVSPLVVDLNGDSKYEKVSLGARPDEKEGNFAYNAIRVAVGDKECLHESWFYTIRGVLIHEDNNKNYLYVQIVTDSDYPILSVFDLNGESPVFVTDLNGTGLTARYRQDSVNPDLWYYDEQLISDPSCFSLDTRMDLMSTYSATMTYKLGSDGAPEPLRDYYEIDSDYELTSLKALTADTIDPATNKVKQAGASIPKGTKLKFFRTNGKDTVDMIDGKGTVYRFNVVSDKWPQTVNGVDLGEAFEGTMFAS